MEYPLGVRIKRVPLLATEIILSFLDGKGTDLRPLVEGSRKKILNGTEK